MTEFQEGHRPACTLKKGPTVGAELREQSVRFSRHLMLLHRSGTPYRSLAEAYKIGQSTVADRVHAALIMQRDIDKVEKIENHMKKPQTGFEFYPTERAVVTSLLQSDQISLPGGVWLEPCAGVGRIIEAVREARNDVSWIVAEIDERFDGYLQRVLDEEQDHQEPYGDFVSSEWDLPKADVAIFDPPFSLTMEFVEAAMERAGTVVCLQRQGWFGTQARAEWLRQHCPDTYDLPLRPSFRPHGKTDNCEYSWYVWPDGEFSRRSGTRAMLEKPASGQTTLFGQ